MNYYIGCHLVKAEPGIKTGSGNVYIYDKHTEGISMLKSRDDVHYIEGYQVIYDDGREDFIPKDIFEKSHIILEDNPLLPGKVSISGPMVEDFIKSYEVIERDNKTVIVYATLKNGFVMVESSSCVDTENYSVDIGVQICLGRIRNKIWELLRFVLQSAYTGFN